MELNTALDTLRARLTSQWTGSLPILVENDPEPTPNLEGFIVAASQGVGEEHIGLSATGDRLYRDHGVLMISICVPKGGYVSAVEAHAVAIRQAFNPAVFVGTGLQIVSRNITRGDISRGQSRYYCVTVAVAFWCDRIE